MALFAKFDVHHRGYLNKNEVGQYLQEMNGGIDVSGYEVTWCLERALPAITDNNCQVSGRNSTSAGQVDDSANEFDRIFPMQMVRLTTVWIHHLSTKAPTQKAKLLKAKPKHGNDGTDSRSAAAEIARIQGGYDAQIEATSGFTRVLRVLGADTATASRKSNSGRQFGTHVHVDPTKKLSEEEFVEVMSRTFPQLKKDEPLELFRLVDVDRAGKASLNEFADIAGHALESADAWEPLSVPDGSRASTIQPSNKNDSSTPKSNGSAEASQLRSAAGSTSLPENRLKGLNDVGVFLEEEVEKVLALNEDRFSAAVESVVRERSHRSDGSRAVAPPATAPVEQHADPEADPEAAPLCDGDGFFKD
jgi:Ca2+-binding EF-hand superfamily protein